jgi:hypothetical protein
MSPHACRQLRDEVDLIGRFAESYRRKFSIVIDNLNHSRDIRTDLASLRLCVEAVDMMLSSQTRLADALRELAGESRQPQRLLRSAA